MTITLDLDDKNIVENMKAIQELKAFGFSDEQIQTLYDEQVKKDREDNNGQ